MSTVETIKIKSESSDENPLGYIVINKSDFNDKSHTVFDPDTVTKKAMSVDEIKAALAAKNIAIPDTVTKKADLQALLDAAA